MHYRNSHDFSRDGEKMEFSVTVRTLYITSNVFIKKEKTNKYQNTNIFPLDLTFIIPIYMIHIHTEKVSAWGGGVLFGTSS